MDSEGKHKVRRVCDLELAWWFAAHIEDPKERKAKVVKTIERQLAADPGPGMSAETIREAFAERG
ncbi:hypothetical protein GCM10012275_52200 [Longimycelium tulufanense]|uniref:Uncharacterized protein n=1 Tax=Longimycelium tulufanense TaxID=907463 RepID=A0A8J3CGJ7_9PSEU|nr:hypothetical protein [Longimycelium tulufanense]GGM75013.1 hypothetical protein GCM10012275_52200 [Longimycelium tulufanense]